MPQAIIDRPELPKGLDSDAHLVRNTYECPCGETWQDVWDCACDDECGACGRTISPSDTSDLAGCQCPTCLVPERQPLELMSPAVAEQFLTYAQTFLETYEPDDGEADEIGTTARLAEFPTVRTFILAAVEAFSVERCAAVHRQLGIAHKALERARDVLVFATEVIPAEDLAGDAEAAAMDCVEAMHFVEAVTARVPQVLPMPVAVGETRPVQNVVLMKLQPTPGSYDPPTCDMGLGSREQSMRQGGLR